MWLILFSDLSTRKKLDLNNLFKKILVGKTAIFAICFSKCSLSQLCIWKDYKMCMIKDFMHLYADSIPSCPPTKVILIIVLFFFFDQKKGNFITKKHRLQQDLYLLKDKSHVLQGVELHRGSPPSFPRIQNLPLNLTKLLKKYMDSPLQIFIFLI